MTVKDFKPGDIVVITKLPTHLKNNIYPKTAHFKNYIGLICEIKNKSLYNFLDRNDSPNGQCVLNIVFATDATLRPATDREKFLYYTHGIERIKDQ